MLEGADLACLARVPRVAQAAVAEDALSGRLGVGGAVVALCGSSCNLERTDTARRAHVVAEELLCGATAASGSISAESCLCNLGYSLVSMIAAHVNVARAS